MYSDFKNFQIHLYYFHLPPVCRKTRFCYVYGSNFSNKECNWHLQYESVGPKKIYLLRHGDSFHPALAFIVLLYIGVGMVEHLPYRYSTMPYHQNLLPI